MLHETQPAAGDVPEEIAHLDFGINCLLQHTQPTLADFKLVCRTCGYVGSVCESHYNQYRAVALTADVVCLNCETSGPLTKVFEPRAIGGGLA